MSSVYLLFFVVYLGVVFFKSKVVAKGSWNDDFLLIDQTKSIQGACAIGIVLHHLSQKTCAPWLNQEFVISGLEPFLNLGHLFVAIFFFFSGFGLFKSVKIKENYLSGFLVKHFAPIIILYIIVNIEFYQIGKVFSPYTWYINAIIFLYIVFYLSFRFIKNDLASIIIVFFGIVLYCVICNWLVLGVWWYNSIGLFLIGLLFAKYQDVIVENIKKHYLFYLIFSVLIFGATFIIDVLYKSDLNRELVCLNEFASAFSFVTLVLLVGLKIFVEMFGYSFVSDEIESVFYIKNLFIYVVAVFALSIAFSVLYKLARKGTVYLIEKNRKFCDNLKRDVKKWCYGLLIILSVFTIYSIVDKAAKSQKLKNEISSYAEKNIQFVEVDNQKMSTYVVENESESSSNNFSLEQKTIVLLSELEDPCPTISLKNIADALAQKYRVIVIDYFGTGFSDSTKKERSAENLVSEIHSALNQLGVSKNKYSILTVKTSARLAQFYSIKYSEEIEKIIGIDGNVESLLKENLAKNRISEVDYINKVSSQQDINYLFTRLLNFLGYKKYIWPLYDSYYAHFMSLEERQLVEELFFSKGYNKEISNTLKHQVEIIEVCDKYKYPESIQVVDFVSNYRTKNEAKSNKKKLELYYQEKCKNPDNHKFYIIPGSLYTRMVNPKGIVELM